MAAAHRLDGAPPGPRLLQHHDDRQAYGNLRWPPGPVCQSRTADADRHVPLTNSATTNAATVIKPTASMTLPATDRAIDMATLRSASRPIVIAPTPAPAAVMAKRKAMLALGWPEKMALRIQTAPAAAALNRLLASDSAGNRRIRSYGAPIESTGCAGVHRCPSHIHRPSGEYR